MLSPWFDKNYYLNRYPEIRKSRLDPISHYLTFGAFEGRNPSEHFDTEHYLEQNPDVFKTRTNPLIHYLRYGQAEGRLVKRDSKQVHRNRSAETFDWESLLNNQPRKGESGPTVDIIVPVYLRKDITQKCLYRVFTSKNRTPSEIVVINDSSPDSELTHDLRRLACMNLITLIENNQNVGFVRSVNAGMRLHPERDVVLLNSDTEVFSDWLDRLKAATDSGEKVATVTPLSNNATICSYPTPSRNNPLPPEVSPRDLDESARLANEARVVEIPTAVGFCMYIRRECLNEVGLFDEIGFPDGYGEENDFCLRASAKGWIHLAATDTYVWHLGSVSYRTRAARLTKQAVKKLNKRYPGYDALISEFVRRDPLEKPRTRINATRISETGDAGTILMIAHDRGGGVERNIQDMCRLLNGQGVRSLIMRPGLRGGEAVVTSTSTNGVPDIGTIKLSEGFEAFAEFLKLLKISNVQVHHTVGYPSEMPGLIIDACRVAGISYDFTAHDYFPVCPRINMIDESGVYCRKGGLEDCQRCINRNLSPVGKVSIAEWRRQYSKLMNSARRVAVFNSDVKGRLSSFFPKIDFQVKPPPDDIEPMYSTLAIPVARGGARIAIIGSIGRHKGSEILVQCARDALARGLDVEYVIYGKTDRKELYRFRNVEVMGQFSEGEIHQLLEKKPCHLAFFPSVWPETYLYTLSIAFKARIYPVAFDLGAPANRIRNSGFGELLPIDLLHSTSKINDRLLECVQRAPTATLSAEVEWPQYPDVLSDYYQLNPSEVAPTRTDLQSND